jgi:hypothetical protein
MAIILRKIIVKHQQGCILLVGSSAPVEDFMKISQNS